MGMSGGLDINSMVNKIVETERAPKQQRIERERTDIDTNISAYGRLRESLDTMKDLMASFRQDNAFSLRSVTSTDEEVISATATHEALAGKYAVDVQQLAQAHKLASNALAEDTKFGPGKLLIELGDKEFKIDIKQDNASFVDVARAINESNSNPGVRASIIKDDEGSRLILASDKSGAKNEIKISVSAIPGNPLHNFGYQSLTDQVLGPVDDMAKMAEAAINDSLSEDPTAEKKDTSDPELAMAAETKNGEEKELAPEDDPNDPSNVIPGWSESASGTLTDNWDDILPTAVSTATDMSMPASVALSAAKVGYEQAIGMTQLQSASDAKVVLDGIAELSSETNVIKDAIQGVDLTLKSVGSTVDKPVELDIQYDRASVKASIERFVEAYNQFYAVSQELGSVNPRTGQGGPLSGDSIIRSSESRLKSTFSSPVTSAPESIKTLSELGISTTRAGTLEINYSVLDRQINENFTNLHGFFGGSDGFAKKVEDVIQAFTGSTGSIRTRENSLVDQGYRLDDEQVTLDRRMESLEGRTFDKFSAMQEVTGKMQSQLSGMMNAMSAGM